MQNIQKVDFFFKDGKGGSKVKQKRGGCFPGISSDCKPLLAGTPNECLILITRGSFVRFEKWGTQNGGNSKFDWNGELKI